MGCSSCERRRLQREARRKQQNESLAGTAKATTKPRVGNVPSYGGQGVLYMQGDKVKARQPFIIWSGSMMTLNQARPLFTLAGKNLNSIQKQKRSSNRLLKIFIEQNNLEDKIPELKKPSVAIYLNKTGSKYIDLLTTKKGDEKAMAIIKSI